jgi:hypothetical protein
LRFNGLSVTDATLGPNSVLALTRRTGSKITYSISKGWGITIIGPKLARRLPAAPLVCRSPALQTIEIFSRAPPVPYGPRGISMQAGHQIGRQPETRRTAARSCRCSPRPDRLSESRQGCHRAGREEERCPSGRRANLSDLSEVQTDCRTDPTSESVPYPKVRKDRTDWLIH